MFKPRTLALFSIIFVVSACLRWGLVTFNRESNDDHFEVIQLILKTNRLPGKADCGECYQPKLFHFTAAKILQLTEQQDIKKNRMILAVEKMNFTAGLIILVVIGVFLLRLNVKNEYLKVLAFGLVALNPMLIGINSQATNDTFAILFSTLALFSAYAYLHKQKPVTFLFLLIFTVLGISSKTNGWVTAIAILLTLVIKAWMEKQQRIRMILVVFLFALITVAVSIFNPLNQYLSNFREYGSPILLNIPVQPFPQFFAKTPTVRPGILSIQDGIFTFKFMDLLSHPLNDNAIVYPPPSIRTSLWTQLYGRAYSVHFDNWPPTWSSTGGQGFTLSRAIYLLALLPTILLLIGAVMEIILVLKGIIKRDTGIVSNTHFGLTAATFVGFILFIILYTLEYRNFSVMKVIFIYPALITFPLLFMRAGEALYTRLAGWFRWMQLVIGLWIGALLVLFCADIFTLILHLYMG